MTSLSTIKDYLVRRLRVQRGGKGYRGIASMLDQGVVSGTGFLAALILVRLASQEQFGAYAFGLSILVFAQGLFSSLVSGPMTILCAALADEAFARRFRTVVIWGGWLALAFGAAVGGLLWGISPVLALPKDVAACIPAVALAVLTYLLLDFARKAFYTRHAPERAFVLDSLYGFILLSILGVLWCLDRAAFLGTVWIDAANVFYGMALSGLLAAAYGFASLGVSLRGERESARPVVVEFWLFGRWGLLSNFIGLGYLQVLYFILVALGGAADVARIEGPKIIVTPCIVALMAWSNVVAPTAARLFTQDGSEAMVTYVRRASVSLLCGVAIYLSFVVIFPLELLETVLGSAYRGERPMLLMWAAITFMIAVSTTLPVVFIASRQPKFATFSRMFGCAIGLVAGVYLTLNWGAIGSLSARLLAEASMVLVSYSFIWYLLNSWRRGVVSMGRRDV